MHYIFRNPVGPGKRMATFTPDPRFKKNWNRGAAFDAPPPSPLVLTWIPEKETGHRMSYYSHGPVLMLKELVSALREAGVDSLHTYPVVIKSTTGKADCHDYLGVNIIGLVAAADMEKSVVLDAPDGPTMTVVFETLVIDENRARGMLFFRLAQSASTVVIDEPVVKHLQSKGGFGLTFMDPAEFTG